VVKPEVAEAQLEAEKKKAEPPDGNGKGNGNGGGGGVTVVQKKGNGETDGVNGGAVVVETPQLCRFHGSAKLDPMRLGRDAAKIAEEIVQHLSSIVGADVEVTLEIQAHIPDGASPELVRTITENCRTLKFDDHGFEEE
jgi:acetylornithine deacetylase/succinyl-diaminopimelate desuccinylase-like protein